MTPRAHDDPARPPPDARQPHQHRDETGSTPGHHTGRQSAQAKPAERHPVRIEIVDGPDGTLIARQAAPRGARTEGPVDDSAKPVVIVRPREFRLPDVLKHIEAGKVVLVVPSLEEPEPAA